MAKKRDETTVSIGMEGSDGKMHFSEPFPAERLTQLADKIGGRIRFFDKETPHVVFTKFKPSKDKDGKRWLFLNFTVPLTPDLVRACDAVIQAGYETVENLEHKCCRVEIEEVYAGVNVAFFPTMECRHPMMSLPSVNIGAIAIERSLQDGTALHFGISIPYLTAVGHWAVDNWGTDFWATIIPANRVLGEPPDEPAEARPQ